MDACAARCSKWVYSWWLNPLLQWDASHLIWACLKMGPPVMSIFGWENDDRAGGFGKNPSKSLFNVQIPNPFCGSWCLKRSHFYISLHHGSQASLFAKRHGSFQFYRGSFAGAGFSCPGRTFGCTLGHPRIRWNSPPIAPPKMNRSNISNIKLGFHQGCSMMFREFILVGTATFPLCFSVRKWFSEETRDFCCKIVTFLVVTVLERGFSSTTWKEHKEDPPELLSRSKWYYCACIYL